MDGAITQARARGHGKGLELLPLRRPRVSSPSTHHQSVAINPTIGDLYRPNLPLFPSSSSKMSRPLMPPNIDERWLLTKPATPPPPPSAITGEDEILVDHRRQDPMPRRPIFFRLECNHHSPRQLQQQPWLRNPTPSRAHLSSSSSKDTDHYHC